MLFKYCTCGFKTGYGSATPPKFCSSCGQPFDASMTKIAPKVGKSTKRNRIIEADEDEEENDNFDLPEINKIAIELVVPESNGQ